MAANAKRRHENIRNGSERPSQGADPWLADASLDHVPPVYALPIK
jgi:hypothetical protein